MGLELTRLGSNPEKRVGEICIFFYFLREKCIVCYEKIIKAKFAWNDQGPRNRGRRIDLEVYGQELGLTKDL